MPGKSRCENHKPKAWRNNNADKRKYKGRNLQQERERLFRDQPLCADCKKRGRVSVATIRDHIVPLAEGGEDTPENTQGLCDECHNVKTKEEAAKGRGVALKGCDVDGVPIDKGHHWRK